VWHIVSTYAVVTQMMMHTSNVRVRLHANIGYTSYIYIEAHCGHAYYKQTKYNAKP